MGAGRSEEFGIKEVPFISPMVRRVGRRKGLWSNASAPYCSWGLAREAHQKLFLSLGRLC